MFIIIDTILHEWKLLKFILLYLLNNVYKWETHRTKGDISSRDGHVLLRQNCFDRWPHHWAVILKFPVKIADTC